MAKMYDLWGKIKRTLLLAGAAGSALAAQSALAAEKDNEAGIGFEAGFHTNEHANLKSLRQNADFRHYDGKAGYSLDFSHTEYFGEMEGKNVEGRTNMFRAGIEGKLTDSLYLAPYVELRDDVDPLREFSQDTQMMVTMGLNAEFLLAKPVSMVGGVRLSNRDNTNIDWAANLGAIYYYNDNWLSLRAAHWTESLRDVNTAMSYLVGKNKLTGDFDALWYFGAGTEYGKSEQAVFDFVTSFKYNFYGDWDLNIFYNFRHTRYTMNSCGMRLGVRF